MPPKGEYYDLKELKRQNHRLDRLVDFVAIQNQHKLQKYKIPSKILPGFYLVMRDLVRDFRAEGIAFVKQMQDNKAEYGYLYNIIADNDPFSHVVYINYENFPLLDSGTLAEIKFTANKLSVTRTEEYEVTCLYLLMFYALLVNRHVNWVMMEYITNCNIGHSYAIHVNWFLKPFKIICTER
ncbi:hypothetical protein AVEN_37909-1 [Araneus ventricosus]|uniref:Uncharacterized protein n=1 Tax=Araneus ventricosus TaxID=182803 RepID=A0A4Y2UG51_ARAVE|nr:hypothetical protein AVEN_37909-1 [Araneus ventricosus]